jgi:PKD repeat protein
MNFDLVHLRTPGVMLIWRSTSYASVAAFRSATGQEARGVEADPAWRSPATGDFHLNSGSPAIDSANSGVSGQPDADLEGTLRFDDNATLNTGTGPRTYDDRGALEYAPAGDQPPHASLTVSPASGTIDLSVTADASASTDTDDTPIASYRFDFGDGSAAEGPQPGAIATHTYTQPGDYTVTATVTDTAGLSSTATATVSVKDLPPVAALDVRPASGEAPLDVTADASASTDGDATPIASYRFDFGDGTVVGPQAASTAAHTYTAPGTYTARVTVTDSAGLSSSVTRTVRVTPAGGDLPPSAQLSVNPGTGTTPLAVTADASASTDGDATPIASYRFDFGDGTIVGPQAGATAPHTYTSAGSYTVTVTVTDSAGLASTATAPVTVSSPPASGNLVGNPGFETNTSGWNISSSSVSGVVLARVAGGHSGGWGAKITNTGSSTGAAILNDSPNWVLSSAAGTYTTTLWVRSDVPGATIKLKVREYNGSTSVGSAASETTLTTLWQPLTVNYTVTSPGTSLDLNLYVSSAAPGSSFYADDASITLG